MTPIPQQAMPIVEILRRDVKRPELLPTAIYSNFDMREQLRWTTIAPTCPMGLLPTALKRLPSTGLDFKVPLNSEAVMKFSDWWDHLPESDAQEAVDAIWGPR